MKHPFFTWSILALGILLFFACQSPSESQQNSLTDSISTPLVRIAVPASDHQEVSLHDLADQVEIIRLSEEGLMAYYSAVQITDTRIYVLSTMESDAWIQVFDRKDGALLLKKNMIGKGPDEVSHVSDIHCADNQLYIVDAGTNQVAVYDQDLQLIRKFPVQENISSLLKVGDQWFVEFRPVRRGEIAPYVGVTDADFNLQASYFYQYPERVSPVLPMYRLSTFQDRVHYWDALNDTLFTYDKGQQAFHPSYYMDFGDRRLPALSKDLSKQIKMADFENLYNQLEATGDKAGLREDVLEFAHHLYFSFKEKGKRWQTRYHKSDHRVEVFAGLRIPELGLVASHFNGKLKDHSVFMMINPAQAQWISDADQAKSGIKEMDNFILVIARLKE